MVFKYVSLCLNNSLPNNPNKTKKKYSKEEKTLKESKSEMKIDQIKNDRKLLML